MNRPLTAQQQTVYDFIRDKIMTRGYGPTVREIGEHMNIKSPNGVMCHLRALERKGMIIRTANKSRAIELRDPIARGSTTSVPIRGMVQQGRCRLNSDFPAPFDIGNMLAGEGGFAVQIEDDFLRDHDLIRGDVLLLQPQVSLQSGRLAVVGLPDQQEPQLVRILLVDGEQLKLEVLSRRVVDTSIAQVEWLGRVVALVRRFL